MELTEIYEKIPKSVCKEGCFKCCRDVIQMSVEEKQRMGGYENHGMCVHCVDGKCNVYDRRAFVCRLYGTSELLPCSGCTPERYLTAEETAALVREYNRTHLNPQTA